MAYLRTCAPQYVGVVDVAIPTQFQGTTKVGFTADVEAGPVIDDAAQIAHCAIWNQSDQSLSDPQAEVNSLGFLTDIDHRPRDTAARLFRLRHPGIAHYVRPILTSRVVWVYLAHGSIKYAVHEQIYLLVGIL